MNLNYLRIFYEVAKNKSFSRAAHKLHITQPAVSIQIKRFEKALGFRLIDKIGRELELTEVGEVLYGYAEEIFRLVEEAREAMEDARHLKWGSLRLGTTKALAQHFMSTVVAAFQDRYPNITVHLDEGSSEEMVEGVLRHRFEVAITGRVHYPQNLKVLPLARNEVFLTVSARCELPSHEDGRIPLEFIKDKPVILREKGSCTRKVTEEAFRRLGFRPAAIIEASNTDFIKDMVSRGKAISFLTRLVIERDVMEGRLRLLRLKEGRFFVNVDLIYLDGKTLSPPAAAFKALLEEEKRKRPLLNACRRDLP